MMALIKMAMLLLLFVIQLSHTFVQYKAALAGKKKVELDYSESPCSNWSFTNDTVTDMPTTNMNGVSIKYAGHELHISNINGYHEGLYKCSSDHSVALNLTVYAVPQFQSFGTYVVSNGQSTVLNISLDYINGGARGAKQNINAVVLKKGGSSLLYCYTDDRGCSVKKPFIQDYTQTDDPSNFIASVRTSNVNISNNGTYEVEVELNGVGTSSQSISTSTSTFNLLVMATSSVITTSSIVSEPSVMTSILSSTIMTTETSPVPSSPTTLWTTTQTPSVSSQTKTQISTTLISSTITTTSNTPSTTPSTSDFAKFLDKKSIIMIAVLMTIISIIVIGVILSLCLVQRRRKASTYSRNVIKMFNPTSQSRREDEERQSRDRDDKRSYSSEAGESATSLSPNFLYDTIPAFVLTLGPGNSKIARV